MPRSGLLLLCGGAAAQRRGSKRDFHLPLPIQHCTRHGCREEQTSVTLDANWRWLHDVDDGGYHNCYGTDGWNKKYCADAKSCSRECALEGLEEADWKDNYGVTQISNGVKLKYIPGSRMYLLDSQSTYKMFQLKNKEFSLDIDVSEVPCGVNGAVYFSEMERDGGIGSSRGLNEAGAEYGVGYCDAQCPTDIHFIGGYANIDGEYGSCCAELDIWEANREATAYTAHPCRLDGPERVRCHKSSGRRRSGPSPAPAPDGPGCCSWAANDACGETTEYCAAAASNCQTCGGHWVAKKSTGCCSWASPGQNQECGQSTPYCTANADNCGTCGGHWIDGLEEPNLGSDEDLDEEDEGRGLPPCDGGKCDQPGCDFNPYRNGARNFFGPGSGYDVDTRKPFTVITQFLTHDGTDDGELVEMRRSYVQDGKTIANTASSFPGLSSYDSLKDDTCAEQKAYFNRSGSNEFKHNGGMRKMGEALGRGMVLALSIWDDGASNMQWLDGWDPEDKRYPHAAGADRGPCARDSGDPTATRKLHPDAHVTYSNIRYGEIGSTHERSHHSRRRRAETSDTSEVVV